MQIASKGPVYVFLLPSDGILGTAEDERADYSNVEIRKYDENLDLVEGENKAEIFSAGKLGTLHGGLLHIKDFRKQVTAQDMQSMQEEQVELQVAESRQEDNCLSRFCCLIFWPTQPYCAM